MDTKPVPHSLSLPAAKPPTLIVNGLEPSISLELGTTRRRLSGPSAWRESLSTLDIPIQPRSHRGRSIAREQDDRTESSNSPKLREATGGSNHRQQDLTPDSALSGSIRKWNHQDQSDDEISIYTTFDRGYTAAEQRYTSVLSSADYDAPGLFNGIGAHSSPESSLDSLIRSFLQPYGGIDESGNNVWLPFDKLFQLVNESSVYQELSRIFDGELSTNKLENYAVKICGPIVYKDGHDNTLKSSSRSIFAILTLMKEVRSAIEFVDAGLSDKDLPLGRRLNPTTKLHEFYSILDPRNTWHGASYWDAREFDYFLNYQCYMLSPFFELNSKMVPFYDLHASALLPFIEDEENNRRRYGHHGAVWRVKIHPAHHDFNGVDNNDHNPYFAVKALNSDDADGNDFKHEVSAWAKSVGSAGHAHLIRLLATWRQKGRWHLLFPWANCNLLDYWEKKVPEPSLPLAMWIAKQCLGLAEGLRKIHRSGSEDPHSKHYLWGIHGDIKPENVLLFDDLNDSYGKLVICDFGFTRFHSKETRSNAKPAGYTGTYRAPEYDMKRLISRVYDIWSLGCLYLEFITWYLTGYEGVYAFCSKRTQEDRGEHIRMDKFFVCVSIHDKEMLEAMVKPCVLEWIRYLRTLEHCSRFFHDFLDIIETEMIVIDTASRQRCDRIVVELKDICNKCTEDEEPYFFIGCPRSMTEQQSPVNNGLVRFPHPFMETERMRRSESPLLARFRGDNTWMVASGSSGERLQHQVYNNIGSTFEDSLTRKTSPLIERHPQAERDDEQITKEEDADDEGEADEETPLLSTPGASGDIDHQAEQSYLTTSPEPLERKAFISDLSAALIESNDQRSFERAEAGTEEIDGEQEVILPEVLTPELYNDDSVDSMSIPAPASELSGSFHERGSTWREAVELLRRISGWLGRWFGCMSARSRSEESG